MKMPKFKNILILAAVVFLVVYMAFGDFQSSVNDFISDRLGDTAQDTADTANEINNELFFAEEGPGAIAESDAALNGQSLAEYRCNIRIGNTGNNLNPFTNSYNPEIKDLVCTRTNVQSCSNSELSGGIPAGAYLSWKRTHLYKFVDQSVNEPVYAKSFTPSFLYVVGMGLFDYRKRNVEFCATRSDPRAHIQIDGATYPSVKATVQ